MTPSLIYFICSGHYKPINEMCKYCQRGNHEIDRLCEGYDPILIKVLDGVETRLTEAEMLRIRRIKNIANLVFDLEEENGFDR